MDFDEYQKLASQTAMWGDRTGEHKLMYITLGVLGEAGEIAEKIKKMARDDSGALTDERRELLKKEIGDVLWYLAELARAMDLSFQDIAEANIQKLADRQKRDMLHGSGDNR